MVAELLKEEDGITLRTNPWSIEPHREKKSDRSHYLSEGWGGKGI